jgi:glycine cleavage system H protein
MANYKLDTTARYAKTHEWVRMEDGVAVVGISDAAQDMISDVVYVELPQENADVKAGAHVADIESVKAAYEIFAPVTGKIIAVNRDLEATPELVNEKPFETWFFKIAPSGDVEAELTALLSPQDYDKFVEETEH